MMKGRDIRYSPAGYIYAWGGRFDTCREIRKTSNVPVVILTALSDDESQLLAYEIGADDFIIKPFKKDILLAKIRRISERISVNQHLLKFGGLEIDKDSYRILVDSRSKNLHRRIWNIAVSYRKQGGNKVGMIFLSIYGDMILKFLTE